MITVPPCRTERAGSRARPVLGGGQSMEKGILENAMTETVEPQDRRLLRRQMLADDVYEAIKTMLMDHAIRPGARISIDGLARDFQVSSTPVREALARLESEGLADKEPLKGYRATPLLTLEEFDDLYRFRQLLEPWA